jgi:hypothetical protein
MGVGRSFSSDVAVDLQAHVGAEATDLHVEEPSRLNQAAFFLTTA